jgi:hypothetical protein
MTQTKAERLLIRAWEWGAKTVVASTLLAALFVAWQRWNYPLELEWMESGVLVQAMRWQQGLDLYPEPSANYVPFPYPPVHGIALGILGLLFPLGFALARALALFAFVSLMSVMGLALFREGKTRLECAVIVSLFVVSFSFCYHWYDVARPDVLALSLLATGALLLRESWGRPMRALLAGVFLALACWTKQTMLLLAFGVLVGGIAAAPRQLIFAGLATGISGSVALAIGYIMSEGRVWTYLVSEHTEAPFNWQRFLDKTWWMYLHAYPGLAMIGIVVTTPLLIGMWQKKRRIDPANAVARKTIFESHRGLVFWGVVACSALVASAVGYSRAAAEANALIPGAWGLAMFFGAGLPTRAGRTSQLVRVILVAQVGFLLAFEPRFQQVWDRGVSGIEDSYALHRADHLVPSERDIRVAKDAVGFLNDLQQGKRGYVDRLGTQHVGEFWAPQHPWWGVMAGGQPSVASMAIHDLPVATQRSIYRKLAQDLQDGRYAAVFVDGAIPQWMLESLNLSYRVDRVRQGSDRVLPISGYRSRAGMAQPYRESQYLLVRLSARALGPRSRVWTDFDDGSLQGFRLEGDAFGRRPSSSLEAPNLPIVGLGGRYALASHATSRGLAAKGRALSPMYHLPDDAVRIHLLVGFFGQIMPGSLHWFNKELAQTAEWQPPKAMRESNRGELWEWTFEVPPAWINTTIQLQIDDASESNAIVVDDLWLETLN